MRTHLLRTFYVLPEAEPDTGRAANDTHYELPPPRARLALAPAAPPAASSAEDDYVLGGYAGI